MHRPIRMLLALLLLTCTMTGCFSRHQETGGGYLFTTALSGDPGCLDPQFTDDANAATVITNLMEGLLRLDAQGVPVPAGAESYSVSDDGRSYLFDLRTDCYWYDPNGDKDHPDHVTAEDYVFAFRRLLDPATRSPHAQDFTCIKNAIPVLAGVKAVNELGVSAPDPNTVLIELDTPEPDLPLLLTRYCAVPCNEAFFRSTNGRYGLTEDMLLCNGAFYLTKWNYDRYSTGNFLTMRKNSLYYAADEVSPSSLQFDILPSREEADKAFESGEADVMLTEVVPAAYLHNKKYTVQASACQTMGLIFNPEKDLVKNDALRQALAYGIDRNALLPLVSEDVTPAYGVIPPAAVMLGRSYRELLADETLALPHDPEQARSCFAEASEALGLTSMNSIRIMVPSTLKDTDAMLAVCQEWQDLFSYYIGIETVSPEEYERRLSAGEYSIALYCFSPDSNCCGAVLEQFTELGELFGIDGLALRDTFRDLGTEDAAQRVARCGEAEKAMLDTHAFIPLFYKNTYLVYTADNQDIRFVPFSGAADFREAKHFED